MENENSLVTFGAMLWFVGFFVVHTESEKIRHIEIPKLLYYLLGAPKGIITDSKITISPRGLLIQLYGIVHLCTWIVLQTKWVKDQNGLDVFIYLGGFLLVPLLLAIYVSRVVKRKHKVD